MKRKFLSMLLCSVLLLSACNSTVHESQGQSLVLGYSQLGSKSVWRLANTEDIKRAAATHGIDLMLMNANQQQEKQIDAIRSLIAYRVDVIAFAPIVETGWDNVLSEAKAAGIPVIVVDRMIETDDETLYKGCVGADHYQEGIKAANYLLRKADDLGKDHLNIVEITGTIDSTPMRQRSAGFFDTLAGDSRFVTLESISGDFLTSKAKQCMTHLLNTYGDDIDVLFSHNDDMTYGAMQTIQDFGYVPGKDIIIITIDGGERAIDLLKAGSINCVVECTPMLGDLVMELSEKLARNETIPTMTHPVEKVFTEYDDLNAIAPRGY